MLQPADVEAILLGAPMETTAVWVPMDGAGTALDRPGVAIVFRPDYYLYPNSTPAGLLEFTVPAGLALEPRPCAVWRGTGASVCCGIEAGVRADLADGSHINMPLHKRTSLKLGLPTFRASYPVAPLSRAADSVEAAGYRLVPLHPIGALGIPDQGREALGLPPKPAMVLWADASGEPRGWSAYTTGCLVQLHYAVAGQQLLVVGTRTVGFARLEMADEIAPVVAAHVYHDMVARF